MTNQQLDNVLKQLGLDGKPALGTTHILQIINYIQEDRTDWFRKNVKLKRGDVCGYYDGSKKRRPCVVIRVGEKASYVIPLTTCEDEFAMCPFTDERLLKDGYFSRQIVMVKNETLTSERVAQFENLKLLKQVTREIQKSLQTLKIPKSTKEDNQ